MSGVHYCDVDLGRPYRLPGVEPPRALTMTFSAQRYDPLCLPPTLPVGNGTTEQRFHDVQEMILAEMPPALLASLAFPPPRAVLSPKFTLLDSDINVSRGQERWAQKFHNSRENARKCACFARRNIAVCLLASGAAFRNAVRYICDAIMQVVEPLVAVVRDMVPERVSISRVTLH